MLRDIYRIVIVSFSRSIAKFFLFLALSISTPTVNAMRSLQEREPIVIVVGYSFNNADEHFNDIIRVNKDKKFDIVGPQVHSGAFLKRVEKVFGVPTSNWTSCHVQGKPCKKAANVRLITCNADEINLQELFAS